MSGINPPPPFNDVTDIEEWMADLEDYFIGKFSTIDDQNKLAILRRVFGEIHICTVKELISRMTLEERGQYDMSKLLL